MTPSARVAVALATLLVGIVTLVAVVGVFIVISSSRQQETLNELKGLLQQGERQRTLLVECLTLPPKAGMELNEADRVHECQAETEGLRTAAVARIARSNIYLHECVRANAPDLEACIAAKEPTAKAPAP